MDTRYNESCFLTIGACQAVFVIFVFNVLFAMGAFHIRTLMKYSFYLTRGLSQSVNGRIQWMGEQVV